jgi:co-chaperonin GroES (HSP10)
MMPDKDLVNAAGEKQNGHKDIENMLREFEEIKPETCEPIGRVILVKVLSVDSITKGGIFIPPETIQKKLMAATFAEYIKGGNRAFIGADGDYYEEVPEKGDIVAMAKYAGIPYRDKDLNLYRFMNDVDVKSIIKRAGE